MEIAISFTNEDISIAVELPHQVTEVGLTPARYLRRKRKQKTSNAWKLNPACIKLMTDIKLLKTLAPRASMCLLDCSVVNCKRPDWNHFRSNSIVQTSNYWRWRHYSSKVTRQKCLWIVKRSMLGIKANRKRITVVKSQWEKCWIGVLSCKTDSHWYQNRIITCCLIREIGRRKK